MFKMTVVAVSATLLLAGCASTPKTPKEAYLNRAASAEIAARQCGAAGGYASVAAMRADAKTNLASAQALGATAEEYNKAMSNVNGTFFAASVLGNPYMACNSLINSVAWAGTDAPVLPPAPPIKP
jgi:hypothetical protein